MADGPVDRPGCLDVVRGAFTGVFAFVWIGAAGAVSAIGFERSPGLAATAGIIGATAGFAVLVEAMAVPRRRAAGWLLFTVAFAVTAGFGTLLSPFSPRWSELSAVVAALFAAALAGAVLFTERSGSSS